MISYRLLRRTATALTAIVCAISFVPPSSFGFFVQGPSAGFAHLAIDKRGQELPAIRYGKDLAPQPAVQLTKNPVRKDKADDGNDWLSTRQGPPLDPCLRADGTRYVGPGNAIDPHAIDMPCVLATALAANEEVVGGAPPNTAPVLTGFPAAELSAGVGGDNNDPFGNGLRLGPLFDAFGPATRSGPIILAALDPEADDPTDVNPGGPLPLPNGPRGGVGDPVPLPGGFFLFALGGAGFAAMKRRRSH